MCSLCLEIYGQTVRMTGPVPRPNGTTAELFFVCQRCNSAVRERRKQPRDES